jgi:ectoine hydroxylase-related dioxygenase (phytanoyl-CoA dioxygenase family)
MLRALFQVEPVLVETYVIYKPPVHGSATPWHQDEAYELGHRPPFERLTFWLALQDTTPDNSCLYFIRGSHRGGLLPHAQTGGPTAQGGVPALEADARGLDLTRSVSCSLRAGWATLHCARTLHFAPPNRSRRPRRAFILDFAVTPAIRDQLYP